MDMEAGIPRAGAGTQPSIDASPRYSKGFIAASAPDTKAFTQDSASMEAPKAAAISRDSCCERLVAGIFDKSMEPLIPNSSRASLQPLSHHTSVERPHTSCYKMSNMEQQLAVWRKGRPIRRNESKTTMFYRRRNRLFKKAHELSVRCGAEVGAVIISPSGKISEFASSSMSHIIKRYQSVQPQTPSNNVLVRDVKRWKYGSDLLNMKQKYLQKFQRYLFEENNTAFSVNEASSTEMMLKAALTKIHKRKLDLLQVEAQKIIEKGETRCKEENVALLKLTQMLSTQQCVSNISREWDEPNYHQAIFNMRLDILQRTQKKEESYSSNN